MTTALQIIEGGLRYIGVKAAEQSLEAVEAQSGLKTLNDIGQEWLVSYGLDFTDLSALTDHLTTPRYADNAFKAELAMREAVSYQIAPTLLLMALHKEAIDSMLDQLVNLDVQYPDSLPVGSSADSFDNRFFPNNEKVNF